MAHVALVTDSTAYLPQELVDKYNITIVPLYVRFGEEVYRDNVDMTPGQFYARLPEAPTMPATSQPPPGDFVEAYQSAIKGGASEILSIHISSHLSGTISSALLAKEEVAVPVHVVDSLSTTMGQGFLLLEAARALEAGRSVQDVISLLESLRERIRILFIPDTLEFLHRGGRIGGAQAFLGSLLNLKPLLAIRDGRVEAVERVRTKRRAVQRVLDLLTAEFGDIAVRAAVIHTAVPDEAKALREQVIARLNCKELMVAEVSPVIGTHAGPGLVGIVLCPVLED